MSIIKSLILNRSLKILQFFINKGVSPNYSDILNQTVLFYIAREGKINCVDYLVNLGCNVNHKDEYGQTPIYYAARFLIRIFEYFI